MKVFILEVIMPDKWMATDVVTAILRGLNRHSIQTGKGLAFNVFCLNGHVNGYDLKTDEEKG